MMFEPEKKKKKIKFVIGFDIDGCMFNPITMKTFESLREKNALVLDYISREIAKIQKTYPEAKIEIVSFSTSSRTNESMEVEMTQRYVSSRYLGMGSAMLCYPAHFSIARLFEEYFRKNLRGVSYEHNPFMLGDIKKGGEWKIGTTDQNMQKIFSKLRGNVGVDDEKCFEKGDNIQVLSDAFKLAAAMQDVMRDQEDASSESEEESEEEETSSPRFIQPRRFDSYRPEPGNDNLVDNLSKNKAPLFFILLQHCAKIFKNFDKIFVLVIDDMGDICQQIDDFREPENQGKCVIIPQSISVKAIQHRSSLVSNVAEEKRVCQKEDYPKRLSAAQAETIEQAFLQPWVQGAGEPCSFYMNSAFIGFIAAMGPYTNLVGLCDDLPGGNVDFIMQQDPSLDRRLLEGFPRAAGSEKEVAPPSLM